MNRWYWLYVAANFMLLLLLLVAYVSTFNVDFFVAMSLPSLVLLELSDVHSSRRR